MDLYVRLAFEELFREDGLCVMARGCGICRLLMKFVQHYSTPGPDKKLVFLINMLGREQQILDAMLAEGIPPHHAPKVITNEIASTDRSDLYSRGGCFIITSRILIVDLLDVKVNAENVTGLLVANAHKVSDVCIEAFILRVFRERNRTGFIKAFSDEPEGLTGQFGKMERTMKLLWLKRLYLWPRFQGNIVRALAVTKGSTNVEELMEEMTPIMKNIQKAILVAMQTTINELKKAAPFLETAHMTLDNGIFQSFDRTIRNQLDPEWHRLSFRTKQLVTDLSTLRRLLDYLIRYDAFSFYFHLLHLKEENARNPSQWLLSDASDKIFKGAKERVFVLKPASLLSSSAKKARAVDVSMSMETDEDHSSTTYSAASSSSSSSSSSTPLLSLEEARIELELDSSMEPVLECPPKWRLLTEVVLAEINEHYRSSAQNTHGREGAHVFPCNRGRVLILVKDKTTLSQLRDVLLYGAPVVMKERYAWFVAHQAAEARLRAVGATQSSSNNNGKSSGGGGGGGGKGGGKSKGGTKAASAQARPSASCYAAFSDPTLYTSGLGIGVPANKIANLSVSDKLVLLQDRLLREQPRTRLTGQVDLASNFTKEETREGEGEDGGIERESLVDDEQGMGGGKKRGAESLLESVVGVTSKKAREGARRSGSDDEEEELAVEMEEESDFTSRLLDPDLHLIIMTHEQATERANVLGDVRPKYVVLYDPELSLVRQLEIYEAQLREKHQSSAASSSSALVDACKVYYLMYDSSVEEHRYKSVVDREKKAFESLIQSKSKMAICLPDLPQDIERERRAGEMSMTLSLDTRTNKASKKDKGSNQIVIDVREFRCPLPSLLHSSGMLIVPRTLMVGDYILASDICVERKGISDLFQSFASGRLYNQAESMSKHYKFPCLLIEFALEKSFSLQMQSEIPNDILESNITSRLAILSLSFPNLRILWSRSPHATGEIFRSVMAGHENVDEAKAVGYGAATDIVENENESRISAMEMLLSLPGVNANNYREIISHVESIAELSKLSEQELTPFMGQSNAKLLAVFFRLRAS